MHQQRTRIVLGAAAVVVIALVALYIASQRPGGLDSGQEGNVTVAATIFPLADIARAIGQERVNVVLVIPPGVTEHSRALTPQQIQAVSEARLLFQIGHGLDDQLTERITQAIPKLKLVVVDRNIALREFGASAHEAEHEGIAEEEAGHHDTGLDPHYWLTAPNLAIIAGTVAVHLQELDPTHADEYQRNLEAFEAELGTLENELQDVARSLPRQEFIAMHDAWSYFAEQYGLELLATYEPVEGREPSLADLQRLKAAIAEHGISTFYAEPQKATTGVTDLMQREFGLKVLVLDPVGGGTTINSVIELLQTNMAAVAAGSR